QRSTHATASLPSFPASVFPSAPILHRDDAAARGDSRISHQSPLTNHQSLPWSRWDSPVRLELLAVNCQLSTRLTPLECAVPSKHRVLPGFGRNCPSVSPLECAVTQIDAVTPLECAVTKKVGGGGSAPRDLPISIFEFPTSRALAEYRTLPSFPASWYGRVRTR